MSNNFKQKKYEIILLVLIALFPIYKMAVISIFIIAFAVVSVFMFFLRRNTVKQKKQKLFLFFTTTGFYFWMVLSLIHTNNINKGLSELQHGLSLLIFPLIIFFFVEKISQKTFHIIGFLFVCSNIILIIYLQSFFISNGLYDNLDTITFYNLPFRDLVLSLTYKDLNPTYISIWFLFSIFLMLNFLLKNKTKSLVLKIGLTSAIVLLFITTIILSSRITIIAFVISLLVYLVFFIKKGIHKIIASGIILIVFVIMIFNISFLKSRMIDEFRATEIKAPIGKSHNSVNIRVGIYQCSWSLLKDNWLFGVGVGDVQNQLNTCYADFDTDVYNNSTYNTHNQFLHLIISSGIVGLILFLIMFYQLFRIAYKNGDYLYITFMVFILICFITENVLVRINGVLFFAYFNTLFIKRNIQIKETKC